MNLKPFYALEVLRDLHLDLGHAGVPGGSFGDSIQLGDDNGGVPRWVSPGSIGSI